MKTNEQLKMVLQQVVTQGIEDLLHNLQTIEEGDFQRVEQSVMSSIFSVGRGWLEKIMNAPQAEQPTSARRQGACGHRQRLVGIRPKTVVTLLGKVTMRRGYYQCLRHQQEPSAESPDTCSHGEAPVDQLWGLEGGRTSPGVQKVVGYLGASMTLAEVAEAVQMLLPLAMSARQVLHVIQPLGETLIREEDQQVERLQAEAIEKQTRPTPEPEPEFPPKEPERLYIELDGVLARMRRESVVLEKQERGREGDVYREIKVGAVFEASRGRERSELVPGVYVDEAGPIQYVARRTTAQAFGPYLYTLAHACGVERAKQVVVLGDGATWIWRLAADQFPQAVQIVDLWHAREHVWKVAHAVYGRRTPQAASWAKASCELLSEGQIEHLIQGIEALPAVPPEPEASRSVPEIEADYFRTNAERMRYPLFRAQGMHIGSGIAEAACKTVVSTRAKRSGMRWTPTGLDAVLALRTAALNHTYQTFWQHRPHLCA